MCACVCVCARAYVKAPVGGVELGHGAEGGGVGPSVLQGGGRLADQQPGRHQLGGHLRQLELEELGIGTSQHTFTVEGGSAHSIKPGPAPAFWGP